MRQCIFPYSIICMKTKSKILGLGLMLLLIALPISAANAQSPVPAAPAPVVVDTAIVEIILPENVGVLTSFSVSSDSLGFGLPGKLEMEFSGEVFAEALLELETSESWFLLTEVPGGKNKQNPTFEMRVFRLNPFRIKVGSMVSDVLHITGSTGDLNETAAIRMPGVWRTRWWMILLPVLLLAALFIGLYLLWLRRVQLETIQQWEPAPPAWLAAAIDLKELLSGEYPSPDSVRGFMDQLAGISRSYLAGRYLVPAGEMTGREILARCLLKGHDTRSLRRLVKILEGLDNQRYNPELPDGFWSREQAVEMVKSIADVRILPRYTSVNSQLLLEAENAWTWLLEPENHPSGQSHSGGEE